MMACMQILQSLSEKKLAGFGASQGGNLPRPQDHGPLHISAHVVPFCFLIRNWHKQMSLSTQRLWKNFPSRPLRLTSFSTEHFELVLLHGELDHCDGFVYFHGRGQGLAAGWADGSALRNRKKWTQTMRCCRNPKPTTWWKDVSGCAGNSAPLVRQPRSRGPAAMLQPSHLHLRSCCSSGRLLLSCCWPERCRRGPAELARGKGQVDSRLVGVSLQLCWTTCIVNCNWQFRTSRLSLVPTHSTCLHCDLLPPFFNSLSQGHWLQYLFNENTFRTTYPFRKEDEVPEGAVNLETVET